MFCETSQSPVRERLHDKTVAVVDTGMLIAVRAECMGANTVYHGL